MSGKLPKAVQRQLEEAAQIEQALAQQTASPPSPLEQAATQPVQETPAQQPDPVVTTEVPAQPPAPAVEPWEARYRSLKGIFDKDVPALQAKVRELEAKLTAQEAKPQPKAEPEPRPTADPKDIEDFGQDLVQMVHRNTQRQLDYFMTLLQPRLEAVEQTIAKLNQGFTQTAQTAAYTAEETFFSKLTAEVPDWNAINQDQRFLDWLIQVDVVTGVQRQKALEAAQQQYNAPWAAAIFKAWKATVPTAAPPPSAPLESQITPTVSGGGSATPVQPDKPVFTDQQVKQFYNDVALRKYRGREQLQAQIEATINLAIQEGRVVQTNPR